MIPLQRPQVPRSVEILPQEVRITWDDGQVCALAHLELRRRCPCASCRAATGPLGRPPVAAGVRALDFRYVGRYALQFFWSDGHSSGLYAYDELRRICGERKAR